MRENDGRKLDHRTLEQMRFRAVDAVESGVHPEDVAASLGMGRGTVYGWLAKYREGGREALRARPVPRRAPKLSGEQMRRLYALIAGADPRQLEFGFALWTRDMVRTLIRREFNVSLSAVSVGRLLRTLGLSPQRPLLRAWQADPDAVERWKSEEFPAIRARAKAEGATIYFGDEAGVRSDYHAGTTWAPVGQTPVVKATGARHSLNPTTSRPRSSARCAGCRNSRTSSVPSSSTPTFATSPRDQGPLTNELFSRRAPSGFSLTIGGCAGCSATVLGAGSCPGSGTRRRRVSPADVERPCQGDHRC
jgi:transposase